MKIVLSPLICSLFVLRRDYFSRQLQRDIYSVSQCTSLNYKLALRGNTEGGRPTANCNPSPNLPWFKSSILTSTSNWLHDRTVDLYTESCIFLYFDIQSSNKVHSSRQIKLPTFPAAKFHVVSITRKSSTAIRVSLPVVNRRGATLFWWAQVTSCVRKVVLNCPSFLSLKWDVWFCKLAKRKKKMSSSLLPWEIPTRTLKMTHDPKTEPTAVDTMMRFATICLGFIFG